MKNTWDIGDEPANGKLTNIQYVKGDIVSLLVAIKPYQTVAVISNEVIDFHLLVNV